MNEEIGKLSRESLQAMVSALWRQMGNRKNQFRTEEIAPLDDAACCELLLDDGPIALLPETTETGVIWSAMWEGEGKVAVVQATDRRLAVTLAYLQGASRFCSH